VNLSLIPEKDGDEALIRFGSVQIIKNQSPFSKDAAAYVESHTILDAALIFRRTNRQNEVGIHGAEPLLAPAGPVD
jgi:hypothetical protein